MASIILCQTQKDVILPYTFKKSGVNVYSLEEALYYTKKNWKESDFTRVSFIDWVNLTLGLHEISQKLETITKLETYTKRLLAFLTIIPYFDQLQLVSIKTEAELWEAENSYTLLKEEADYYAENIPKKAISIYEKVLTQGEDANIYNNIAISYMKLKMYTEAVNNFKRAYSLNKSSIEIILNYSLALIETGQIEKAYKYIKKAESFGENSDVYYLYGKICYLNKNINQGIDCLNKALSISQNNDYYYLLTKIYISARRYNEALETIKQVKDKDSIYYIKLAEVCALSKDFPGAITSIETAHNNGYKNAASLTALASYYRQNYDLNAASSTIKTALLLENNKLALLEDAKIKKSQGKLRDYQKIMENILKESKENYRNKIFKD